MWGGAAGGLQGVTELTESERCRADAWLREVQEEIRCGCLGKDNFNFLHGEPTSVPGSWTSGDVECGRKECRVLAHSSLDNVRQHKPKKRKRHTVTDDEILAKECATCREQRASKARVAVGSSDPRFRSEKFANAPAISPNNDIKYDVNKTRAAQFAIHKSQSIMYAVAQDTPSMEALRENPSLAANKLEWLKRHDRECGDLYGMLLLVEGMPVALTDHIDRSPEKQLLRGKIGHVHSWILHQDEKSEYENGERILQKLPLVVFIKFPGATWRLPSLKEPGLYPIKDARADWYLDKGRQHPVLKIKRRQLPLAPAFAMTAHAAQGQTLVASITDMQIGRAASSISSYVALTRVAKREDLLIYRPFNHSLFTQGPIDGPDLLLKVLRHEEIDWKAIEDKYTPHKLCSLCGFNRFKEQYLPSQWSRKDKLSVCRTCTEEKQRAGTPYECMTCNVWKPEVKCVQGGRGKSQYHM